MRARAGRSRWTLCLMLAALIGPTPASPAFGPPPARPCAPAPCAPRLLPCWPPARRPDAPRAARRRADTGGPATARDPGPAGELRATHHGSARVVWNADTVAWLRGAVHLGALPPRFNVITSLPDISELHTRRCRMAPEEYEVWFVDVVASLLAKVPPDQVRACARSRAEQVELRLRGRARRRDRKGGL